MPLDALDQKTLNSLPRLSEVYDAYGVQVNALSVNEIFALYERTGFLYPDKARRIMAGPRNTWFLRTTRSRHAR